jgi:uncharacterized membrane protein
LKYSRKAARTEWLPALTFFIVTTTIFTWPLVTILNDTLPDWGDAADSAWRLGSIAQQLISDPLHLYRTSAFFPVDNGLALNELMTGQGIMGAPVIWLTGNPVLAYNLLSFSAFVLCGFSVWLLVRHLTGSNVAGYLAGLIFTFSPVHYGQYGHLGPVSPQWMVFALYFLIRFTESSNPLIRGSEHVTRVLTRTNIYYLSLFCLFFVLQAIVAGYYAYFAAILIFIYLLYYYTFEAKLIGELWRKLNRKKNSELAVSWNLLVRQLGLLALAGLLSFLLILPFVWPFMEAQRQYGFQRSLTEVSYWSAAPNSLLRTVDRSWLYKPVQKGIFNLQTSAERMLYPGVVAVLLAGTGLLSFKLRRKSATDKESFELPDNKPEAILYAHQKKQPANGRKLLFFVIALTGLTLSFGPTLNLEAYGLKSTGIPLPYRWLYQWVPGFDALRVAQRFGIMFMLGLAVCAGYGVAKLENINYKRVFSLFPRLWRPLALVLLTGLITADFIAPGLASNYTGTGEKTPEVYRWLAGSEARQIIHEDALVLEIPITVDSNPITSSPIYLMYGLFHDRPLLNGSANILPPGYERLYFEIKYFPGPASLDILEGLGVQYVIVHTGGLASEGRRNELNRITTDQTGRLQLVRSFPDISGNPDSRAEIYRVTYRNTDRFSELASAIPDGARVLLGDDIQHRRLYTAVLPGLLDKNIEFCSTYPTVYYKILQEKNPPCASGSQQVEMSRYYEYAIFYRNSGSLASQYGYGPEDFVFATIDDADGKIVELYHNDAFHDNFNKPPSRLVVTSE